MSHIFFEAVRCGSHMFGRAARSLRGAFLFVGAVAVASSLPFHANANDTAYYRGSTWQISSIGSAEDSSQIQPYCEVSTISLEPMLISLQYVPSKEAGGFGLRIKLRKNGWNLPVGQTTTVRMGSAAKFDRQQGMVIGPDIVFTAVSSDTLESDLSNLDDEWYPLETESILSTIFTPNKYRFPLYVKFTGGNEQSWAAKPFERYEQTIAEDARRQCLSDISRTLAGGAPGAASKSSTSPFGSTSKPAIPGQVQSDGVPSAEKAPTNSWSFASREEDWGETCFAETQTGAVKVGFMKSPGKELAGFVEGLFKGDVTATWKVDDEEPRVSDGAENDYFGWHEFGGLGDGLLDAAASGHQLTIGAPDGKSIKLSLQGANQAISSFRRCVGAGEQTSRADSAKPVTGVQTQTSKLARSCLLQVNGKKVIDGACVWEAYGDDPTDRMMSANGYFAILFTEVSGNATGYWNGAPNIGNAHSDLGKLKKDGDCWVNKTTRLCVTQ